MDFVKKDLEHIWHPCSQMKDYEELPPIVINHAKGIYLYDLQGKRYMDVISSWWCNLFGHCNERISSAIKAQLDKLEHVIFANFSHVPAITLCDTLSKLTPEGLVKFFFTDNGSSAMETAMKISFQYHAQTGNSQKTRFMALRDAYHGETLGALSVGGVNLYTELYKPLLLDVTRIDGPDCYRCKYGQRKETCNAECIATAEAAFAAYADQVCAIVVEPLVQAAAGMKIYSPVYLSRLRELCDKYNVHLIADEISTGFGRTGKMFACNHADISPDIMCVSKGLTGGYMPMALVITTDKIYDAFYADYSEGKAFMHSHTYCGNPLACSAAIEVLNIFQDENIIHMLNQKAVYFNRLIKERLSNNDKVGDLRQIGLINALELVKNKETKEPFDSKHRYGYQIYKKALEKGVLLRPIGDVIYFNPPFIISETDMEFAVDVCAQCLEEVVML